ncbi:hypothetical protein M3J09_000933 [Ascochyta lentis]
MRHMLPLRIRFRAYRFTTLPCPVEWDVACCNYRFVQEYRSTLMDGWVDGWMG